MLIFKTLFSLFFTLMTQLTLFDFDKKSDLSQWETVDDVVMGGRSDGNFYLSQAGHGIFTGSISTENNGGFSSVQYRFQKTNTAPYKKYILRIKGDGKRYQFRVKSDIAQPHSYVHYIETSGNWQLVEILFSEMYATFRGRKLDLPNFQGGTLEQIGFLTGNKRNENFKLEIDFIKVE
jgi:NADH dehydrogenase [ubiquinone] 1 alpha subcomplex assembly factor 1